MDKNLYLFCAAYHYHHHINKEHDKDIMDYKTEYDGFLGYGYSTGRYYRMLYNNNKDEFLKVYEDNIKFCLEKMKQESLKVHKEPIKEPIKEPVKQPTKKKVVKK